MPPREPRVHDAQLALAWMLAKERTSCQSRARNGGVIWKRMSRRHARSHQRRRAALDEIFPIGVAAGNALSTESMRLLETEPNCLKDRVLGSSFQVQGSVRDSGSGSRPKDRWPDAAFQTENLEPNRDREP